MFRHDFAAKRLERRSEAGQRGVLEDAAEDATAEEFSWPGTLLLRIPAPESTLRRSLARALLLVTKRKRTPRVAPCPCEADVPFITPYGISAPGSVSARAPGRVRCVVCRGLARSLRAVCS